MMVDGAGCARNRTWTMSSAWRAKKGWVLDDLGCEMVRGREGPNGFSFWVVLVVQWCWMHNARRFRTWQIGKAKERDKFRSFPSLTRV